MDWVAIVKIFSMVVMFITILITGLIPIYLYLYHLGVLSKRIQKS